MSPLLVLIGLIGAPSAVLPGPAGAIDVDPRPVAAGQFDPASRAPRGELQPFTGFRARRPDKRYSATLPIGKRSDERRVGKACVSPCRSRWSPYRSKKKVHRNRHNKITN